MLTSLSLTWSSYWSHATVQQYQICSISISHTTYESYVLQIYCICKCIFSPSAGVIATFISSDHLYICLEDREVGKISIFAIAKPRKPRPPIMACTCVHQVQCILRKQIEPFSENSFYFYSYKRLKKVEFCSFSLKP